MTNIAVNSDLCIGCQWCAVACPEGVFFLRSGVLAIVVNQNGCRGTECRLCEKGCPEKTIKVQ